VYFSNSMMDIVSVLSYLVHSRHCKQMVFEKQSARNRGQHFSSAGLTLIWYTLSHVVQPEQQNINSRR